MDHSQHDCLIVAVLSHGELGLLYAHDTAYKADSLWYHFTPDKCPTLAGKPKLFFIQACQGDKLDAGVTLKERTETDGLPSATFRIPTQADFLIAYSTVPGIIIFSCYSVLSIYDHSLSLSLSLSLTHSFIYLYFILIRYFYIKKYDILYLKIYVNYFS